MHRPTKEPKGLRLIVLFIVGKAVKQYASYQYYTASWFLLDILLLETRLVLAYQPADTRTLFFPVYTHFIFYPPSFIAHI